MSPQQQEQAVEWLRDLFDRDLTKLLLSVLIIISVLPFPWVQGLSIVDHQAEVRRRQRAIEKLEKVLQDLEVELNAQLDLLSAGGDIDYPVVNAELQRIQNEISATQQSWEIAFQYLEALEF